jgi:hypothetical protein
VALLGACWIAMGQRVQAARECGRLDESNNAGSDFNDAGQVAGNRFSKTRLTIGLSVRGRCSDCNAPNFNTPIGHAA